MISAPAFYGKLPMLGDYFQGGASPGQTNAWWDRFARGNEAASRTASPEDTPWCFVLPPETLWPGKEYVVGAICLSRDRVGREFPFVIWQSVRRRGLRLPLLFGRTSGARNWLFWLSRLLAVYAGRSQGAAQSTAPHFERNLRQLWEAHQPGPGAWLGLRRRPPAQEVYWEVVNKLPETALHGVTFMPWADWPERLWAPEALCYFWQQDHSGRYLRVQQDRALGADTIARLFAARAA